MSRITVVRLSVIAAVAAAGVATAQRAPQPDGELKPEAQAVAGLKDAKGADIGTATIAVAGGVMRLLVDVRGAPPGTRGIHIHQTGRCDAPGFETAGAHWNPTARQHGERNAQGPHAGDLKNIVIDAAGKGSLNADIPGDLTTLLDEDGAALIIHAGPDDYRTDPSGNSGGRIICGVFSAPTKG